MHTFANVVRGLALVALLGGVAVGQKQETATSALINQELDKTVSMKLDGVLPDVLRTIYDKTGVRIEATDQAYDLLPWGEQTNIRATVENQTLRNALTAIDRKLGLIYELGQYQVWLKPMPALARLGRRATLSEIQSLDLTRMTPLEVGQERMTIQALLDAIDKRLAKLKAPVALEVRAGDPADAQAGFIDMKKEISVARGINIAKALEDLTNQSNATWYPWGNNIVVVPKQQQIRLQLEKTITAHFNGTDISRVIDQLQQAAGVPFHIEPGAFQRVPQPYRSVRLDLDNAPIHQVLDDIRGLTGLDYVVKPDGVYLWNQNPNPSVPSGVGPNDPVVAIVHAAGGVDVLLRESEATPEMREYLTQKKQAAIEQVEKQMKAEGFVPTTRPTTQPAH